jgi:long-chain acyl-CoA synthetase
LQPDGVRTSGALPACSPATLLQRAAAHPDRIALRHKDLGIWREYSWRDYAQWVARQARAFHALGVARGDRVAILADNRPEWVVGDMALQAIGAVVVGVYSTSPSAEVEYVLAHSESVVCVVEDEEQLDKIVQVRDQLPHCATWS